MQSTRAVPPPTHREVTPVRTCSECGAYLRSYGGPGGKCWPCEPTSAPIESFGSLDLVATVSSIPGARYREQAFDALRELQEEAA